MNHAEEAPESTALAQASAEDVEKSIALSRDEGWVAENDEDVEHDQEESEHPEEPEPGEQCTSDFAEVKPTRLAVNSKNPISLCILSQPPSFSCDQRSRDPD
jgi:hypothetical protein